MRLKVPYYIFFYGDKKLGKAVDETVIPYPANQKRGVETLLCVDQKFITYGPEDKKENTTKDQP
jgi:hypothetical protein